MSAETSPIRTLAADDHPLLRQGIASLVVDQSDMTIVAEASNGREAIQQFRAFRPDVTLMDLQMPEMNGTDAIIAIRGEFPEAHIIVFTTYAGDVQALRALKAGARAYLLKNLLHKELLDTIRAVHAGKKTISAEVSFELAAHVCAFRSRLSGRRSLSRTTATTTLNINPIDNRCFMTGLPRRAREERMTCH